MHKFGDLDHYHNDLQFAFTTNETPQHKVGEGESEDTILVTAVELRALSDEEIFEDVREVGLFILEECLPNWESVNGWK